LGGEGKVEVGREMGYTLIHLGGHHGFLEGAEAEGEAWDLGLEVNVENVLIVEKGDEVLEKEIDGWAVPLAIDCAESLRRLILIQGGNHTRAVDPRDERQIGHGLGRTQDGRHRGSIKGAYLKGFLEWLPLIQTDRGGI